MTSKVQAVTASPKITLTQALENTKKAWGSKNSKEGPQFYLGHNFQLLTHPPRKEHAPSREELVKELQEIASVEEDSAKNKEQIKKLLRRLFKQPDAKDKKDEKQTAQSVALSSFQASVQAFLASGQVPAKKTSEKPLEPIAKQSEKTSFTLGALRAAIEPIFTKYRVKLTNPAVYNANTNDFGMRIKTLRCALPDVAPMKKEGHDGKKPLPADGYKFTYHFGAQNIEKFGEELGFSVVFTKATFYPRDNFFRRFDDQIVTFPFSENIDAAQKRAASLSLYLRNDPLYFTSHYRFESSAGGSIGFYRYAYFDLRSFLEKIIKVCFYFEGGDLFKVTHPQHPKRRKIFMGEETFMIALNQMRLDKQFEKFAKDMEKIEKEIQEKLTKEQIVAAAREMFAQGLLKLDGKDGFIGDDKLSILLPLARKLDDGKEGDNPCLRAAEKLKLVPPFSLKDADIKKVTPYVVKYLAQKQMLKSLIAKLGCAEEDLHLIPPFDHHIDTFMRPGPKGSMFLQDYSFSADLLRQISANAVELHLSRKDREILARYIKTADMLAKDLAPLAARVKAELARAGYTVIPTPANFYDADPRELSGGTTYNVNFMNSLTGFSDKEKCYYCITSGAKVGDQLGKVLMDSFEQFMSQYENTRTFFMGFDPKDPTDFSEAMNYWNTFCQAGAHCFTFEQETAENIS